MDINYTFYYYYYYEIQNFLNDSNCNNVYFTTKQTGKVWLYYGLYLIAISQDILGIFAKKS